MRTVLAVLLLARPPRMLRAARPVEQTVSKLSSTGGPPGGGVASARREGAARWQGGLLRFSYDASQPPQGDPSRQEEVEQPREEGATERHQETGCPKSRKREEADRKKKGVRISWQGRDRDPDGRRDPHTYVQGEGGSKVPGGQGPEGRRGKTEGSRRNEKGP
uniref:Uncharacterized protein n=1 Tax=Knipowitschia caucasica TaxID=637954 RepID=A0AAV2M3H7_KNICA